MEFFQFWCFYPQLDKIIRFLLFVRSLFLESSFETSTTIVKEIIQSLASLFFSFHFLLITISISITHCAIVRPFGMIGSIRLEGRIASNVQLDAYYSTVNPWLPAKSWRNYHRQIYIYPYIQSYFYPHDRATCAADLDS